jgi:hypothetical protein
MFRIGESFRTELGWISFRNTLILPPASGNEGRSLLIPEFLTLISQPSILVGKLHIGGTVLIYRNRAAEILNPLHRNFASAIV